MHKIKKHQYGSTITPGAPSYPLNGNYAFQGVADFVNYPATALGGVMETTGSNGAIRGLGAGIRTLGGQLTSNIGNEIYKSALANSGNITAKGLKNAFSTGLKNTFSGSAGLGFGMGAAGTVLSAIAGPKSEYKGLKGGTTQALDTAYDGIATGISFIPGGGQVVAGAMSLAKGVGDVLGSLGGGTDGMTDVDAVLGSSFFNWNIGALNGFGGKRTHKLDNQDFMNQNRLDQMWSGYADALHDNLTARTKSGKKYGMFSSGARKRANKLIDTANMNQEYLLDMQRGTELGNIRGNNMASINSIRYNQALYGGVKPVAIGKQGLKISDVRNIINNYHNRPTLSNISPVKPTIDTFQNGGKPKLNPKETGEEPVGYLEDGTPLYKKGDGTIGPSNGEGNLFELIRVSNANFAKRLQDPNRKYITYPDGSWDNFKLAWSEDETGTIVYPEIQEIDGKLVDLSNDRDAAWKSAIEHGDYVVFPSNEAADWFTKNYKNYYKGFNPQAFKQGGQMNLIPEGSLHARLHHMEDAEGLTKKGIPVVDNDGNQQAEIEVNEIIFRKEVTDKLEELAKDGSNKAAEEAGRLLVKEIFENTDDRTGLIEEVTGKTEKFQGGGSLLQTTGVYRFSQSPTKISTKDILELQKKIDQSQLENLEGAHDLALTNTNKTLSGINQIVNSITNIPEQIASNNQQKENLTKLVFSQKLEDSKQQELANIQFNQMIKAKEMADNSARKQLYSQTNPQLVAEGDKLPEQPKEQFSAGENVIKEILSLPPEKLAALQNILKYLKQ